MHRNRTPLPLFLLAAAGMSTTPAAGPGLVQEMLPDPSPAGEMRFTLLDSAETGIDFTNPIVADHPDRRLFASSMVTGGVAVGDVDGDGLLDVFFASGPAENRLFRQKSPFHFEDITAAAGVSGGDAWGMGVAMVDIDNDGDLDLYVCNHDSPNQLFLNNGKGVFEEAAAQWGIAVVDSSHTPAFCDYDLDGDLDLFLLTNHYYHPDGKIPPDADVLDLSGAQPAIKPEYSRYIRITETTPTAEGGARIKWEEAGRPDYLFRNEGGGSFRDVTREAGIASAGFGLSATWWDYNRDGLPDLYVANDFNSPDYFYQNNGDGTFTDRIVDLVPHTTWFSMGADFGDLDGNGWDDFLLADMSGTNHYKQKTAMGAMGDSAEFLATAIPRQYMRNALYLNTGAGRFREGAFLAGLSNTDWTWAVKLCDFDNDARLDVLFTNGMSKNYNESDNKKAVDFRAGETQWDRHTRAGTPELREQNLCFRNLGDLAFEDVSKSWGYDRVGMSFAAAHADLDGDGDLDLITVNLTEPADLHRNDSGGNRILVRLQGTSSNLQGIGAHVSIESGGLSQTGFVMGMRGYLAWNEPIAHFGLGSQDAVDRLVVEWPGGKRQEFRDLAANARYTVTEPAGPAPGARPVPPPAPDPLYVPAKDFPLVVHQENTFDDFMLQPLLPNRMSQWGPGIAVADIDGDGDEDFALGGASGSPTQIGLNQGGGRFAVGRLASEQPLEDMGLLFFDANGDGHQDLYIVSGGSEYRPGLPAYKDRLYLNNGKGNFLPAPPGALPDCYDSGSVVVAADYDRDGDLDLFIGGRFIPGSYPETPSSRLLRNDGGRFTDVTAAVAPALAATGLVTAALFSDADADGWIDLLVAHEWGPVKLYRNREGSFDDVTEELGLAPLTGWWNSLAAADFDGDGDMDYFAGNFGLNTKYHASAEQPALIYFGDFVGNGQKHIVEAEFENETLFPIRGRSCSSMAMPHLAEKFKTYHDFALASVTEIYTEQRLQESLRLACHELQSGVFLNDGPAGFRFLPLPRIAQIAPVFGAAAGDFDGDGHVDLYLAQNFYGPQVETGHMDGGVSQFLRGRGDGSFDPVEPLASGLVLPGDAKGLAVSDLDGDEIPDFLVALNNGPVRAFLRRGGEPLRSIALRGPAGNPTAAGARIEVQFMEGPGWTAEIYAGSGYLSQSSPRLTIPDRPIRSIMVRWPTGESRTYTEDLAANPLVIAF